ncbi:chloride channel protein [Ruminococcus sp.]|uniref:chloride channel protein n=1 Tax=Ruminococcus sp. TaxID=41978 RepID=UPI00261773CC|nr:chloride channel protein [Ruminococcus sp.]MDD6989776.1 chloride channel protein [Ruminococcus sp.]MDY6201287.1 chloride channel protein [Ruminococcus sp.]
MKKVKNNVLFLLYTVILGAIVGAIVWAFIRIMNLGIEFIWDYIPSNLNFPFYTLCVCVIGGLLIGVWKKKFGDYPEELSTVMGKVKNTGRYQYNNVFSTVGSALFPLLIGASVGPEAGLTGIIAGLCTWVGDKLKLYFKEVEELTQIGLSATLGTIFHSPMFGFIEPIESDKEVVLPRTSKIVLYFAAILSSFGVFFLLGNLFGGRTGLENLETNKIECLQYLYAIPLAAVGIAAGYLYFIFKKLTFTLENKLKKYTVLRATAGGLLLGISGTFLPLTMFSGEHQISEVMNNTETIGAIMLIVIAVVKLLLTNICIDSGLKGGHFFPVIFCGICIGCAMSLILGIDTVFCASVVTTSLVGHTLKKPLATVLLLMIVFPVKLIPVMLFAAIAAKFIETPKALLTK